MKTSIVLFATLIFCQLRAEWKMPLQDNSLQASSSFIVNQNLRFAVGRNYIYKSVDQGKTWQKDSLGLDVKSKYVVSQSICFSGADNGYVLTILQDKVTYERSFVLHRTTDTGSSWTEVITDLQMKIDYKAKLLVSDQRIYICSLEAIAYSDTEGAHWQELTDLPEGSVQDFKISGDDLYLLCGENSQEFSLFISANDGRDWQLIHHFDDYKTEDNSDSFFLQMYHVIESDFQVRGNHIYIVFNIFVPSCGLAYQHTDIYHLEYGLHAWTAEKLQKLETKSWEPVNRILFISDDTAYASSGNSLFKTVDGGKTWFRTFDGLPYENGTFANLVMVNGRLMAYTEKGIAVVNEDGNKDINLHTGRMHNETDMLVFPNPSNRLCNFILPSTLEEFTLTITNAIGQTVFENRYSATSEFVVNTSDFAQGNYVYTIRSAAYNHSGSIIIP